MGSGNVAHVCGPNSKGGTRFTAEVAAASLVMAGVCNEWADASRVPSSPSRELQLPKLARANTISATRAVRSTAACNSVPQSRVVATRRRAFQDGVILQKLSGL